MKKFIVFLFTLAFIFSFNSAGAITNDDSSSSSSGCLAGDNFSRTTGKPCNNSSAKPACKSGDLFDSVTGKPCDKTEILPMPPYPKCDRWFNSDLKIGSRGAEVLTLQQSLKEEGLYAGKVDGVYGPITDGAKLSYIKICPPKNTGGVVISGVSGPQTLDVNQTGTWKVSAYDKNGGNLSYTAVWGDVFENRTTNSSGVSRGSETQQSATFTHSYSKAGYYTPTFTVNSDNNIKCIKAPCPSGGGVASTSLSVKVGSTTTESPFIKVLSPDGGESYTVGVDSSIPVEYASKGIVGKNVTAYLVNDKGIAVKSAAGVGGSGLVEISLATTDSDAVGKYRINLCVNEKIEGKELCDKSDGHFMLISGTTTSQPTITLVSKNITTENDAKQASGSFKFKVYSPAAYLYVYSANPKDLVRIMLSDSTNTSSPKSAVLTSSGDSNDDTANYFIIEKGETRTFTLSFAFEGTQGTGLYRAKATSLKFLYDTSDPVNFGGEFVSNSVYLNGSGPIAMCDYANPPEGCTYVAGPNYNPTTQCGMVLSCTSETPTFACSYAPPVDGCTYVPGPNYNSKTGCGMVLSCDSKDTTGTVRGAESFNFTLLLKKGSSGNEVMELQKFLKGAGYGSVSVDGNFGSGTESAVMKFQLANGLKADGVVGSGTRALLNK